MVQIDLKLIEQKKQTIESARTFLKAQFIGIDNIIDDLLDYIQIWYLMPDILTRPVIVNLWGMTGVGKTDLVRKLVKCLDYQDRFAEVELSNVDNTSWENSVASIMENHGLADEKPSIILFDEIQRFNTLDSDGAPIAQTKYMDFWELLSDGRLSKKSKEDLDYYLFNFLARRKEQARRKAKGEEIEANDENPLLSLWEARELQKMLGLQTPLDDMTDITEGEMIDLIVQAKKKKKIYEPIDYSKTLILISGNLDEAFSMSGETSEADIDADIFHAFTKKITLVDIKNSLSRKFRPEQVARFGNIHLIYNSLRKEDFEKLIRKEIERIIKSTQERLEITLTIDESINELVYRNGVFPVQGVRPVFSSIIDILEANLSKFFYTALMGGHKNISVSYDHPHSKILATIGKDKIEIPYVGRIDKIREDNVQDTVASISVHECGHAVAYMVLMGLAPLQLKSKVASSYAGGFTFPHQIHETKENLVKKIKIYLAGGIAEEMIFGKQHASIGRSHDRETATQFALDFVRRYGFDDEFQATYTMDAYPYMMDKSITDTDVEKMMTRLVSETKELLSNHIGLLRNLSVELSLKGTMSPTEIAQSAKKYNLNVLMKEEGFLIIADFEKKLQELA
ncbi:MAG: AAA family ATPase [Bacteroidetes bacterium]|nr:MAG: AAA family ATPase [Bacteroidota bacterium]